VSAKKLHEKFESILNDLFLDENLSELFKLQLRKIYYTLNVEREHHAKQYKSKVKELDEKIERLEERFINEEIKGDLYEKFSSKFKEEKKVLEDSMLQTNFTASNFEKCLERATNILRNSRPCGLPAITRESKNFNTRYSLKEFTIIRKMTNLEPQK
jgi:hypothetical protein